MEPSQLFRGGKEHKIILGNIDTEPWSQVTLVSTYRTNHKFTVGGTNQPIEEYGVGRGFFGAHLVEASDYKFRKVQFRLGDLGGWIRSRSGFRNTHLGDPSAGEEAPLLYHRMPVPAGGQVFDAELMLGCDLSQKGQLGSYLFTERPSFSLSWEHPKPDEEIYEKYIHPLRNLITFVCDRAQRIDEISLWHDDTLTSSQGNPEIRLVGPRAYPELDEEAEPIHPIQMLFRIEDIEEEFASFVERWLSFTRSFEQASGIYFGLLYRPPGYLDISFMGIVQVLSLYYVHREDGKKCRDQEEARRKEVLSKLSESDADWVRDHIWDRPFPPLDAALTTLLREHEQLMLPLLQNGITGFVNEVVNTVNFVVRRDPEAELLASHGGDLYWVLKKLRFLLKACFLRELNFTPEKIAALIQHNQEYMYIRHLAASRQEANEKDEKETD